MRKGKGKKRGTAKAWYGYTYIHIRTHKKNLNDEKEAKQPLLVPCLTDRETRIEWTRRSRRSENVKKPVKDKERKREARSLAAVGSHGCAAYLHLLSPLSPHHAALLAAHRSFSASCSSFVSFFLAPTSLPPRQLLSFYPAIRLSPFDSLEKWSLLPRFALSRLHLATSFIPLSPVSFSISSFLRWNNVPPLVRSSILLSYALSFATQCAQALQSRRAVCICTCILIIAENGRGVRERRNSRVYSCM